MKKICKQCGHEYAPKRKEQEYCSRNCASVSKGKMSVQWMSKKRNHWKGGVRLDLEGYVRIYDPATRKYLRLHRVIANARNGEIVHHKNENKKDNRMENLEILSAGHHSKIHNLKKLIPRGTNGRFTHA